MCNSGDHIGLSGCEEMVRTLRFVPDTKVDRVEAVIHWILGQMSFGLDCQAFWLHVTNLNWN